MYGEADSELIEEKHFKPITDYKCTKCKLVHKCYSQYDTSGCPNCDRGLYG